MEGKLRRTKAKRLEIVPKGEKRGQLLCSGDDIDIKINGIWLPTRIAYADDKGGYYAMGLAGAELAGREARTAAG